MKRFLIFYFLFLISFFSFFSSGFVDSQDGFQYLAVARRFYHDRTFALPEEEFPENNIHMTGDVGNEGKRYSPTGLGYTLALLPAVSVEDIFLKATNTKLITAFPLQSDWPVLLFASFTNSIFGAFLAVILYLYFVSFKIKHRQALIFSFFTIIATNLFPYTKHTFAHMMFISFLAAAFYFLRRFSLTKRYFYLVISGFAYGVVVISYNPTFVLALPALGIYYLFLSKQNNALFSLKQLLIHGIYFSLGTLPFVLLYFWFNWVRFGSSAATGYGNIDSNFLSFMLLPPAHNIFEGLWGVLLSPGRSIFVYSPILTTLVLFWFKLKKDLLPEIISFFTLAVTYIYFTATLLGGIDFPVWHGETSWGPRYLTVLLPFAAILIAHIYLKVSYRAKVLVFLPLIVIGVYIQILGIIFPYQIKFAGLQLDAFINGRNFNMYEYGNEIPRYSPVFKMSKTLVKRIANSSDQFNHGEYNITLFDGFNLPFDLGPTVWREVMPQSRITFDNSDKNPVEKIYFKFGNYLTATESAYPVNIKVSLNDSKTKEIKIPPSTSNDLYIPIDKLNMTNNISITTDFIGTDSARLKKKQAVFLQELKINDEIQNIETIDYPYISRVSENMIDTKYGYWGNLEKDPWEIWYMHSGVYEQTFDLWWLRPFHYWDLPKKFFLFLFILNITVLIYSGYRIIKTRLS